MNDRNNSIAASWMSRRSPPPTSPAIIKPIVQQPVDRPSRRHSAITGKFPNWQSYKSWVDKARGSWDEKKK
jgi:hypothetical protein